ncbi:Alpha-terpineol synthase, chloroplastic [Apostasia shenzhenica]|uniref:Alpha-terpineol synthase, chloroplastic n=1 Tax=Apostasia shenzhenica TaxID=1088818 RepID=A0A2I0AS40_9ASPA|nr:Alpha-terpineol synthase, chloroplastic [Apostasia shenzhenica]
MLNDHLIQSLTIGFTDEEHARRRLELKESVSRLICKKKNLVDQLELIDSMQQLGIAYHFEKEVNGFLSFINSTIDAVSDEVNGDVKSSALLFRLLRQQGFFVSQDMLVNSFKDEEGRYKAELSHDMKGLLSLYEASFLAWEEEEELEKAKIFAAEHLIRALGHGESELTEEIEYSMELPLHWRAPRLHALRFIHTCEKRGGIDPSLLELAKLDFNMVQSIYKDEVKDVSRWWRNLGLSGGKLGFARDWPVESYIWTVGLVYEPQFSRCRRELAKMVCFLHLVDDIYDVYGSPHELELFTTAVERWEVGALDELPEYMKICYLALFNTTNDIAYSILKDKGVDTLPYLKKAWRDICNAFLAEARWYNSGYIPKFNEYMDNAWISGAAPLSLIFAQCLSQDLTHKSLQHLQPFYPSATRYSSTIFRLYDDIGTSKVEIERGDVAKSIQCYVNEKNVVEERAREKIKDEIHKYWKLLNQERANFSEFEETFKRAVMNLPRMAHFMYYNRDGNGKPNHMMKNIISSLLIDHIPA